MRSNAMTGTLILPPAKKPTSGESRPGIALDETDLAKLVTGFKSSSLFALVALIAATGMRRNEALALRWSDLDVEMKTIRVERAWESTKSGMTLKAPKTKRGVRSIDLGDDGRIVALLLQEKERHQRIKAGVPDDAEVNLSLVKLPADG